MRLPLFAVLALSLAACDGGVADVDPLTPDFISVSELSQDPDDLVGTWELVAEVYYETIDGRPLVSPASGSDVETWTFDRDGTAMRTENGAIVYRSTWRVVRQRAENGTRSERPSLLLGDGDYSEEFGTAGDVLVLDRTPYDGPQSRYRLR